MTIRLSGMIYGKISFNNSINGLVFNKYSNNRHIRGEVLNRINNLNTINGGIFISGTDDKNIIKKAAAFIDDDEIFISMLMRKYKI